MAFLAAKVRFRSNRACLKCESPAAVQFHRAFIHLNLEAINCADCSASRLYKGTVPEVARDDDSSVVVENERPRIPHLPAFRVGAQFAEIVVPIPIE